MDDSLVDWLERAIDIEVLCRTNRAGHKAGALKEVNKPDSAVAASITIMATSTGNVKLMSAVVCSNLTASPLVKLSTSECAFHIAGIPFARACSNWQTMTL